MRFQPPSTSRSPRLACCLHFSIDHTTYTFAVILLQQISSIAQSLQYGLNPGLAVELSIGIVRRSLRNKSNELRLYRRGPKPPDRNILYEARAYGGIVIIPILYLKSPRPSDYSHYHSFSFIHCSYHPVSSPHVTVLWTRSALRPASSLSCSSRAK